MNRKGIIFLAIISVVLFYLGDRSALLYQSLQGAWLERITDVMDQLAGDIAANPLLVSMSPPCLATGGLAVLAVWLCVLYNMGNGKNYRKGEEYGSAKWGTEQDRKYLRNRDPEKNIILSQTEYLNLEKAANFEYDRNKNVVVVGGSGTGKSSLLGCITGASPCTSGSVCFDGIDTRGNRNAFDAVLGYVPQKDIMHDELTVEQSLTYTAKLRIARDATRTEIKAAVAHAIEAVDLGGREKTMIANLSGGQKKRVSIAMELLASPRLLILDEPTSGLSPDLDRSMMELCRKLSHENCTVLMVTHNMSNINLCDKIAFLGTGGVLCYYGSPEAMDEYFDVELTSDIFEKLHDPEQVEYYRRKYFTSPEFNRLAARFPAAAKEAEKRCKA